MTAPLFAVDLRIPSTGGSTSGCEAADFAGFPAGAIALIQRGTCDFVVKVQNAINAGASAVILFNEGNAADRMGLFNPATTGNLPVLAATFAVGQELANGRTTGLTGTQARVRVDIISQQLSTRNVIAETSGREDNVWWSVRTSTAWGSARASRTTARVGGDPRDRRAAEKVKPRNAGAVHLVRCRGVRPARVGVLRRQPHRGREDDIAAMLNFDMIASPELRPVRVRR